MSTVYTQLLGRHVGSGTTPVVLFTANSLWPTIVRDVVFSHLSAATQTLALYVVITGGAALYLVRQNAEAGQQLHFDMRQRLEPGDQVVAQGGADGWSVSVTGYLFQEP